MRFLTDFADLAVLLPLSACIFAGLLLFGWRRGALAWAGAVGVTLALMLALKLLFLGCGRIGALSPSGHTAAGTAIYGGVFSLWLRRRMAAWQAVLLAGGTVGLAIGISRLAVHAHIPIEVAMGAAVGLAGVWILLRAAGPPPPWVRGRWLVPAGLVVVLLLHGTRLQAEPRLRALAGWIPHGVCTRMGL